MCCRLGGERENHRLFCKWRSSEYHDLVWEKLLHSLDSVCAPFETTSLFSAGVGNTLKLCLAPLPVSMKESKERREKRAQTFGEDREVISGFCDTTQTLLVWCLPEHDIPWRMEEMVTSRDGVGGAKITCRCGIWKKSRDNVTIFSKSANSDRCHRAAVTKIWL